MGFPIDPAQAVALVSGMNICPECGLDGGHKIRCKTGNARVFKYQSASPPESGVLTKFLKDLEAPDSNVESVKAKLDARATVGLVKYGVTTERGDLSLLDWLRHAQEEALDLPIYLEAAIRKLEAAEIEHQKDKARLDWLDSSVLEQGVCIDGLPKRGLMDGHRWAIHFQGSGFIAHEESNPPDIRAAIDIAMAAKKES